MLNYLKGRAAEKSAERAAVAAEAAKVASESSKAEVILVGNEIRKIGPTVDAALARLIKKMEEAALERVDAAYAKGRLDEATDGEVGHNVGNGDTKPETKP